MPDEDTDAHAVSVPNLIRSEADYQRVMERIMEITHWAGMEPRKHEFGHLLEMAEWWENRARRR
jgi:hypothetical protein